MNVFSNTLVGQLMVVTMLVYLVTMLLEAFSAINYSVRAYKVADSSDTKRKLLYYCWGNSISYFFAIIFGILAIYCTFKLLGLMHIQSFGLLCLVFSGLLLIMFLLRNFLYSLASEFIMKYIGKLIYSGSDDDE